MTNSWYVMLWKSNKYFNDVMRMCIDDSSFGISYDINKDLNIISDEEKNLIWNNMGKTNRQKNFYKRTLNIFIKII